MNEGISVRQYDILWRFYCKRFLIEGKEVETPKNLCRYFWTSVNGFGLWLGREVKLRNLWLISLVATATVFAMARAFPDENNTIVITILVVAIAVLWNFAILTAIFVTTCRMMRVVEARAPWVMYLLGSCVIVLVIVHMVTQGTLWPEFTRLFGDSLQLFGYVLMAGAAMIIIGLVSSAIPHRRLQKLQRAFQTFGAFVSAKKSRVCPPVNPPEDFKVKP